MRCIEISSTYANYLDGVRLIETWDVLKLVRGGLAYLCNHD